MNASTASIAASADWDLVEPAIASEIETALRGALHAGVQFHGGRDPLAIFRAALAGSIKDIESDRRGHLLQEFLAKGPFDELGEVPADRVQEFMIDAHVESAVDFLFGGVMNHFKGALAELLASKPSADLVLQLKAARRLPASTKVFQGDLVHARVPSGRFAKAADLHLVDLGPPRSTRHGVTVHGIAEIKSGYVSPKELLSQIASHLSRPLAGLSIDGQEISSEHISVAEQPLVITVFPSKWKLSRDLPADRKRWFPDPPASPLTTDLVSSRPDNQWRIELRWSEEALASAAYDLVYWYMARVGEIIYREQRPKGWEEMTPAEAGQNAVKMQLYYAIRRAADPSYARQKAVALYNTFGFGYALGMNFRNGKNQREMLWPQDLDEIAAHGKSRLDRPSHEHCRIVKVRARRLRLSDVAKPPVARG